MASMPAGEFIQYTSRAKKLADQEPVFITERGTVQYVFMRVNDFAIHTVDSPSMLTWANEHANEALAFPYDFEVDRKEDVERETGFQ